MITDHEDADVRRVSAAVAAAVAATATAPAAADGATKPKPKRGRPRVIGSVPALTQLAGATRLTAAVILEVLAGERSTSSAAKLIGVSLVRYYAIESRAIAGLIAACTHRPSGA
ncbi:MAG TPA: hypothetical protein VGP44_06770, partial [Gemmatimonadales bacterium]|nr:hypothetical protein [Gemmatimonadales bacterium]